MQSPTPVEILTIGREILDGRVTDTNSTYLGYELSKRGLSPRYAQRVDDDPARMLEAFKIAQGRSKIVLVTGGLGPTEDDLTAQVFSEFLGHKAVMHTEAADQIRTYFAKIQRPLTDLQLKQAVLPPSAGILKNSKGTAPGFFIETSSPQALWFFMPGVPSEMKAMFTSEVLPRISQVKPHLSRTWCTHFTSEGELQGRLKNFILSLKIFPQIELTFRTRFPENHIGLYVLPENKEDEIFFSEKCAELRKILANDYFYEGPEAQELENGIAEELKSQNILLGCVESCTGGLVSHRLTQVSGISSHFWASWVTYDNRVKIDLGVDSETITKHGAVSAECAQEMAEAGLKKLRILAGSQSFSKIICIATTGIAGPTGGSAIKPVGLVYTALASSVDLTQVESFSGRLGLDRSSLKLLFSQRALDLVWRFLKPR